MKKKKSIDCIIIGNNQMNFEQYVLDLKSMGEKSGAFRDLNLSYYEEGGIPYSCTDYYNHYVLGEGKSNVSYDNILSATITYLGSYLNRHSISFEFINSFQEGKDELLQMLENYEIGSLVITTTFYVSVLPILEIMSFLKENAKNTQILIGGPFINTQFRVQDEDSYSYLLKKIDADVYINTTQGEHALALAIQAIKNDESLEGIDNIIYRNNDEFVYNLFENEQNSLCDNPVDWELFESKKHEMAMVRTVISCPFSCSFCSFPEHAGAYQYMDADSVIKELNGLEKHSNVKSITFIDDTFNVPMERYKQLLNKMNQHRFQFKWNCNFRCQYADEASIALMKATGCEGVFLGIESGSDTILKNMNKQATVEAYKQGIALLKKYDITTYASFILGFPGETEETVWETIDFIEEVQPDFYRVQLWYYDTMTPIANQAQKYGLKNSQFEWAHNTMDAPEAAKWIDYIHGKIKTSVWLPQNNFDYPGIFNLMNRGHSVNEVKEIIQEFNRRVRNKLSEQENSVEIINEHMFRDATFDF